jgi:lysozyme
MDADRLAAHAGERSNLSAFLMMIRACEGTDGPDGYRTLFGGKLFADYSDHPNYRQSFHQTDGTIGFTTAAGAYQFIYATWKRVQKKLVLPDFSPLCQDQAAVFLISERNALDHITSGNIEIAIGRTWPVWASLPGSRYAQPTKTMEFALAAYQKAGGQLAGD